MKISRRELLAGVAAVALFPREASAWIRGSARGWNVLKLGGGGLIDGFDIAPDGTAICRADSAYVFRFSGKLPTDFFNSACRWEPIITAASIGTNMRGPGIGEAVIAYSNANHFWMMALNNLDIASTADNGHYVYYSKNSGINWVRTNLSWAGEDFVSTERKAATKKLLIDPNNENVIYAGMPNGTVVANVRISDGSGGAGNIVSICDTVGAFPTYPLVVGVLHLWSGVGGTDYGTVSSSSIGANTTTTSSAMTWDITGTTLTIGGTNPQNFVGSVNQGLTSRGAGLVPGTIITAVLGGNQYTVNNSQTVSGSGNTLTASKGTLVGTARNIAVTSMNFTNSILANGAVTSVFISTDGATFSPVSTAVLPQTTVAPGVCCMIFDKNSGTVVGVAGLTVTARALIPIPGADVYETTDGGLTWNATGFAAAAGTSYWMAFYTTMNHSGHVFMTATVYTVAGVGTPGIWRYSDAATPGTWVWERLTTTDVSNHGCLWADPRAGHEGELSYASSNNGPLYGYTSTNANAALGSSVTFARAGGGTLPMMFAQSYDTPWLNYGLCNEFGTYVGANYLMIDDNGYFWWSGNQIGLALGTLNDYTTPAIPNFASSGTTYSATMSRGIENTIAEYICRPPGARYPIKCVQDMGLHYGAGYNSYGTNYYMNAQDIFDLGNGLQRVDCWNASYAPGNPLFVCAKLGVAVLSAANSKQSGYSLDGGLTWQRYTVTPEQSFGILYPSAAAAGHYLGGFILAIDDQHQMVCFGTSTNDNALVTTDRGATTWAACGGLPAINWTMRYYRFGDLPPGQPFAAGQGSAIGTVWAVDAVSTNGTAKIYKSTDSGANFSAFGTNVTGFGSSYGSPHIYSVPGYPDDLWLSANFFTSTNNGVWRSTDGGSTFSKLATLPSGGGKFVQYMCLGKAIFPSTYPTIYLLMWTGSGARMTSTLWYSTDQGANWTQIGNTPLYVDLPSNASQQGPKAIFGDWEEAGVVSISTYGSGFAYYRI